MESKTYRQELVRQGSLRLINRTYPLLLAEPLSSLALISKENKLEEEAAVAFLALKNCLIRKHELAIVSAYRTKEEQEQIYRDSLKKSGRKYTEKYVAVPLASEHQSGLAIDVGIITGNLDIVAPTFNHHPLQKEFMEQVAKFGFILRYPKGKEKITGIGYEPWHFRYVGYPHSQIIERYQLTLEEYIEQLERVGTFEGALVFRSKFEEYRIYTINFSSKKELKVEVPKNWVLNRVSGNNRNGMIVTLNKKRGVTY